MCAKSRRRFFPRPAPARPAGKDHVCSFCDADVKRGRGHCGQIGEVTQREGNSCLSPEIGASAAADEREKEWASGRSVGYQRAVAAAAVFPSRPAGRHPEESIDFCAVCPIDRFLAVRLRRPGPIIAPSTPDTTNALPPPSYDTSNTSG